MEENRTAEYSRIPEEKGARYRFFCGASGAAVCTTESVCAGSQREEVTIAWEQEGKQHFNLCHKCGKWVCDAMYNADTLNCVDCSPWEEVPQFCPACGSEVSEQDIFCRKCGVRLMYGGDEDDEGL